MTIRITAKGLEMSDPTFDELSRLKQLEQSIALAERERILGIIADGKWVGASLIEDMANLANLIGATE